MRKYSAEIAAFFNNELSEEEMLAFRQRLKDDEDFAQAFKAEGASHMELDGYRSKHWTRNSKKSIYWVWGIVLVGIIGVLLFLVYKGWEVNKKEEFVPPKIERKEDVNSTFEKDSLPKEEKIQKPPSSTPKQEILPTKEKKGDGDLKEPKKIKYQLEIADGSFTPIPFKDYQIENQLNYMSSEKINLIAPSRDTTVNRAKLTFEWTGEIEDLVRLKVYTHASLKQDSVLEYKIGKSPFILNENLKPDLYYWEITPLNREAIFNGRFYLR